MASEDLKYNTLNQLGFLFFLFFACLLESNNYG